MGEPALTILGDVCLVTGNVRHTGSVRVSGSVQPGFVVEAAGDVLIRGDVRGGHVISDGSVTIRGIVTGPDALVDALGFVRVRQATDARLLAGKDLTIESAAERCDLSAGRRVLLNQPPGVLRGGTVRAGAGVEVHRAEGSCGHPVRIRVGHMPFDDGREQVSLRLQFAQNQATAAALADSDSPETYRRKVATVRAYRHLAVALERRLRQIALAEKAMNAPYLRVEGERPVDAVVTLGSVEDVLRVGAERPSGAFLAVVEDGEVSLKSLKEAIGVG